MDRRRFLLTIAAQSATWQDEAFSPLNGSLAPAKAKGPFKLGKLIGRTLAVNQLIKFERPTTTTNGITFTNNGNGSITVSGTAMAQATFPIPYSTNYPDLVAGHKYLLIGCPAGGSYTTYDLRMNNLATTFEGGAIVTASTSGKDSVYILVRNGVTLNVTFYPRLYDLTLTFGSGREPTTVDEFKKVYSRENTAYTLGQLESSTITSIIARKTDSTEKSRLELPNDLTIKSALDAKDEFEIVGSNAAFTKNVGTVDLGSLSTWTKSNDARVNVTISDAKSVDASQVANAMAGQYVTVKDSGTSSASSNMVVSYASGTFRFYKQGGFTGVSTATEIAALFSGQTFNYELATPQTITIPLKKLQAVTVGELSWEIATSSQGVQFFRTYSLSSTIAIGVLAKNQIYCAELNPIATINVSVATSSTFPDLSITQSIGGYQVACRDSSCTTVSDFVAKHRDDVIWFESVNDQAEWNTGTCEAGGEFETGYVSPDAVLKIYERK